MVIKLSPEAATPHLSQWWSNIRHSRFKFAALQNGTAMSDCPSLRAWRAGEYERSVELMLAPENLDNVRNFLESTNEKKAAGISMVRVHLFDEELHERDYDARCYLDWLKEHFRQVNSRWGSEELHWLPKSVCDRLNIVLPPDDTALYDGDRVMTAQYDHAGQCLSRAFFEAESDPTEVNSVRQLTAKLTQAIAGNDYLLTPKNLS